MEDRSIFHTKSASLFRLHEDLWQRSKDASSKPSVEPRHILGALFKAPGFENTLKEGGQGREQAYSLSNGLKHLTFPPLVFYRLYRNIRGNISYACSTQFNFQTL